LTGSLAEREFIRQNGVDVMTQRKEGSFAETRERS
jgi:hypothetical protein